MIASYTIKLTQNVEKNAILEMLEDEKRLFVYSILSKFKGFRSIFHCNNPNV